MRRMHPFHRTELVVGGDGFDMLAQSRVCIIGLGGVGSFAAEALVRSGIEHVTMIDFDKVCLTNVNRQLHATRKTVGQRKAALMGERARAINPKADIVALEQFYEAETSDEMLGQGFDYVLDCIDNMTAKVHLLKSCVERDIPVISAMGAGGRMDPTRIQVSDISKTRNDPFARIVRENLRKEGVESGIECVWTDEPPNDLDPVAQANFRCICIDKETSKHSCERRLQIQGSVAWMPSMFGLTMAGTVVNRLLGRAIAADNRELPQHRMTPSKHKIDGNRRRALLEEAGFGRTHPEHPSS